MLCSDMYSLFFDANTDKKEEYSLKKEEVKKKKKSSREDIVRRTNLILGSIIGLVCVIVVVVLFFSYSSGGSKSNEALTQNNQKSANTPPKETEEEVRAKLDEYMKNQQNQQASQAQANQVQEGQTQTNTTPADQTQVKDLEKEKTELVDIKTDKGVIKIALYPDLMPNTVKNFMELVSKGFYNGLTFHRVEDWVVQGGDPNGNGSGGSEKTIKLETNPKLKNLRGFVAMARRPDNLDSATSQFYILKNDSPGLDGSYAVFGRVVSGMDIVDGMKIGDKMIEVKQEK